MYGTKISRNYQKGPTRRDTLKLLINLGVWGRARGRPILARRQIECTFPLDVVGLYEEILLRYEIFLGGGERSQFTESRNRESGFVNFDFPLKEKESKLRNPDGEVWQLIMLVKALAGN